MTDAPPSHRGTIYLEDAVVVAVNRFPGEQYVVRLLSPRTAAIARAGTFIHLRCDAAIPMRRPLSIMRVDAEAGWIEVLFKVVGEGLRALGRCQKGEILSSMGPIGRGFSPRPDRPRVLLIGGGVGIPPMIFLAETLKNGSDWNPLVLMGSELPFPFELCASGLPVAGVGGDVVQTLSLLESWGVPGRLASLSGFDGTYRGYVTELAVAYLESLSPEALRQTGVFACGPTPMLKAVSRIAADFDLPCQVALEEYMACAVGGCAGCTVRVITAGGPAMQRVCVDGPVFDAKAVFPPETP